ncbi:MAG: GNAT family N-acetyltransferase [Anaerolineales bacterium]|nr:GNAT family N-acetyltransferase [Anaerolineales bacterium]
MSKPWVAPVILTGRHVRLEPLSEAHVPALAAVGCEEEIWRYMRYGQMRTEDEMRIWVRELLALQDGGSDMPFTVFHLASGRVAGATRYMEIRPSHRGLEIGGTWYGLEFQRTVVNTETKYLLLKHAFDILGTVRVQFKADARNDRSLRAIERIGGVREGELRNHMILDDGYVRHSVYFSIVVEEWPAVRKKLEQLLAG